MNLQNFASLYHKTSDTEHFILGVKQSKIFLTVCGGKTVGPWLTLPASVIVYKVVGNLRHVQ